MDEAEGGRIFFSSKGRTLEGEDEIGVARNVGGRIHTGELNAGDAGGGLDSAEEHQVADDRGDLHSGEGDSGPRS